ncbi:CREB/ATF bZIP transcription factor [Talpa occidentalis]|uniref:CREB/ATF bZIP transcription factor n=1 Tax=Talpa occidentalis TaxID=50954 RepID=UPI00188F72F1|nr:CREB/ATF bZIP transcription factor [Talpa occidentalis]
MRHSLTQLLAASGGGSPARSESPAPAAPCSRRAAAAPAPPGRPPPRGAEGEREAGRGGAAARAPSPGAMEEQAGAAGAGAEDMDFLAGLELADLLDPRQPDWPLGPGLGSPAAPASGGGAEGGGAWRADDDAEAAAAEVQRFSDLLQRLLSGGGGGGERRRRKAPGGGGDPSPAAARSPRKAAAAAARLNRLRKKEYVSGLEGRVRALAAENQDLRAENRELGRRVQALQEERRYLRAVLANETGLARLLSRLSGGGLRLGTSLFGDAPAGDHDYALPAGKRPDPPEDDDAAGGVCLHVDRDAVSVEFCAACARRAAALKM